MADPDGRRIDVRDCRHDESHGGFEKTARPRKRGRKATDKIAFETIVASLTANLAFEVHNPSKTGRLAVRGGHLDRARTRYDNPVLASKQVRRTMDLMPEGGFADFRTPPTRVGRGDVIHRSDHPLRDMVRATGVSSTTSDAMPMRR